MFADQKVIVTGLACIHPIGKSLQECCNYLERSSDNSSPPLQWYNHCFGKIPIGRIPDNCLSDDFTPMEIRSFDRISKVVSDTVGMCICSAKINHNSDLLAKTGIISGSAFGCLESQDRLRMVLHEKGPGYFDPVAFPWTSHNFPISAAAIKFGLKGPITAMIASMSAGLNAVIYSAYQIIKGQTDRMIVVAFDEINELQYAFLKERNYIDGTLQEGMNSQTEKIYLSESCVAWMLESAESAIKRKAPHYGTLDTWHLSASRFSGIDSDTLCHGVLEVVSKSSCPGSENIKFVTNGSGNPLDDHAENRALTQLAQKGVSFQNRIRLKPIIGNCLGAASLFEGALLLNNEYLVNSSAQINNIKSTLYYLLHSFGMGGNTIAMIICAGNDKLNSSSIRSGRKKDENEFQ